MIGLTEEEIQPSSILEGVTTAECGASVFFLGSVRSPSKGRDVAYLLYETYREMALQKLEEIVRDAESRWDLGEIALVHRIGKVRVGEISIMIAVSSPHRDESYQASRFILEEVKEKVPIWKKECGDGGEEWI